MMVKVPVVEIPTECTTRCPHLFVHEDVDDGVDDRAGFGQQRGHDAGLRRDEAWVSECGQQGHDSVRKPAEQVADHHDDDHEQDTVLPLAAQGRVYSTDLQDQRREGEMVTNICQHNRVPPTKVLSWASLAELQQKP